MSDSSPAPPKKSKAQAFAARLLSTALLWGGIAAGMIWGGPWIILSIAALFGIAGTAEYSAMALRGDRPRQILLVLCSTLWLGLLAWCLAAQKSGQTLEAITIGGIALAGLVSFLPTLRRSPTEDELQRVVRFGFGFLYIAVLSSFILRLYSMDGPDGGGVIRLLFLIAVSKFSDMGAYLTGTLIGKNKAIPKISPAKTWEGFAGGVVFSLGIALGLVALFPEKLAPLTYGHAAILALILSVLAIIGDLAESVLKRACAVKDSGNWLPGIGGILDLIDSLLFTAPVLWLYLLWLS